ncbi:MAG: hypothetical protein ACE14M_16515 [Terriglobales bacterium]
MAQMDCIARHGRGQTITKCFEAARAVVVPWYVLTGMILYLIAYVNSPLLPGAVTPGGWWNWWDQGQYLRSAAALSKLDFTAEAHWYPPGYALTAAPFYALFPRHPFLPASVISIGVLIWSLHAIFRRYVSPILSLALIGTVLFLHGHVLRNIVIPWNSMPTNAAICLVAYLLLFRKAGVSDIVLAATASGVAFLCRPASAVAFAVLFATRIVIVRRRAVAELVVAIVIAALFGAALFCWSYAVYGSFDIPYVKNEAEVGFSPIKVPAKLFFCFIDPSLVYSTERSLFNQFPWLLLSLPGIVYAWKRERLATMGLLGTVIVSLGFYMAYNNFNPLGMFTYHSVHYILWVFPILAMFSVLTIRFAWAAIRMPCYVALLIAPLVVILCLHPRLLLVATAPNTQTFHSERPIHIVDIQYAARPERAPMLEIDGVVTHPPYHFYDHVSSPAFTRCYLHRPARTLREPTAAARANVIFMHLDWEIWPRPAALSTFFSKVLWAPWKQQVMP